MKIVVLVKPSRGEITPFDGAALECALELGADVTVVSMAPLSSLSALESLTRLSLSATLVSDSSYAGSDTLATSYILAEVIRRLSPDLVFAGRQSIDGDTAQVPPMIAERLGLRLIPKVMEMNGRSVRTRNGEEYTLEKGDVVTFERIRTLRFPSIFSKKREVDVLDNSVLGLDKSKCGLEGSPTRVVRSYESSVGRRASKPFDISSLDSLIREGLEAKREKTREEHPRAEVIYYLGGCREIAEEYAKKAVKIHHEDRSPESIAEELIRLGAKIVFFDDSDEMKLLSARLSVITGSGLCADCISVRQDERGFIMTRPALGGNITADIVATSPMSFATVRCKKSGADVMIAVGRGAVDYIDDIRTLAGVIGAEVVSTRAVVDSGYMPYTSQVGVTGRIVSPRVYIALGVSGAVQHTAAISGSDVIIAVNSDKDARIFDYADFGLVTDIKNLFRR